MRITVIDGCDYKSAPIGGQLSFCKQLVQVFSPEEIYLVGVATDFNEPVGQWFEKKVGADIYSCFNLYRLDTSVKPMVPLRIRNLLSIIRYRSAITSKSPSGLLFVQSPELMIGYSILNSSYQNVAYFFHGVENPLSSPRYLWGKKFSSLFWKMFIDSLKRAKIFLAAADAGSINNALGEYSHLGEKVVSFPTRYDDSAFIVKPAPQELVSRFSEFKYTIVATGRINKVKGWDFTLRAFDLYLKTTDANNACLVFVGGGEDTAKLIEMALELGISDSVFVTGFVDKKTVADYLNFASLYVVGSIVEGWSIAMLEALACGLPIVSTDVSGARTLIRDGVNGYVCNDRNVKEFSDGIRMALVTFKGGCDASVKIADKYKLTGLKSSLLKEFCKLS